MTPPPSLRYNNITRRWLLFLVLGKRLIASLSSLFLVLGRDSSPRYSSFSWSWEETHRFVINLSWSWEETHRLVISLSLVLGEDSSPRYWQFCCYWQFWHYWQFWPFWQKVLKHRFRELWEWSAWLYYEVRKRRRAVLTVLHFPHFLIK